MKRIIAISIGIIGLSACTPQQIANVISNQQPAEPTVVVTTLPTDTPTGSECLTGQECVSYQPIEISCVTGEECAAEPPVPNDPPVCPTGTECG